jgi:pantoate--beta-alanine ligase
MQLTIARDMESLQGALAGLVRAGKRVALVPTMGALHAGHMSLIELARTQADAVVTSIFVNPKQFGPNEDFNKYPRMLDEDINKVGLAGGDLVYAPSVDDLYPEDFQCSISVGKLGERLEGKFRPGFFTGVATVVTKLLLRTLPSVAVFGEKDYQQLCVIRRVVEDLDIGVEIIGAPTLREGDGLAMSSRNVYLSAHERKIAPMLHEILTHVGNAINSGSAAKSALAQGTAGLTKAGFKVDYLELCDADTLETVSSAENSRLLAAAWLGNTRLIDNIAVG